MDSDVPEHNMSGWESCPVEILLLVFEKIDIKSLRNCRNVNTFWRNVVDYYCEHFKIWKTMIVKALDDEGVKFTDKSFFGYREQFLCAQQWLNAKNFKVQLRYSYKFNNSVKNICVYKDNLIVVTSNGANFFTIPNFELRKVINKTLTKYEETSTMILEMATSLDQEQDGIIFILSLTNKLHTNYKNSEQILKIILSDIDSYKLHLNYCYEYSKRVLWVHTAKETGWETKALAKYYGNHEFCRIHIFKQNVFVLLKSGFILFFDMELKLFVKVFDFCIPKLYHQMKPFMFHKYSLIFKAPDLTFERKEVFYECKHESFLTILCHYGITCMLEHGHISILGFENGKVNIYLTRKLVKPSTDESPELSLNIKNYSDETNPSKSSLKIISLDIYEDDIGHHLFVSTMSTVYELLLSIN